MTDCLLGKSLDCMRAGLDSTLTGTARILHPGTQVPDGMGGDLAPFGTVGTVNCSLSMAGRAAERMMAGEVTSIAPWMITMPYDTVVYARDRIQIGTDVYEVVGHDRGKPIQIGVHAFCVRLDG